VIDLETFRGEADNLSVRNRSHRPILFVGLILLLLIAPMVGADEATKDSLYSILQEYRADGLRLVFSSSTVDPEWAVSERPQSGSAVKQVRELLKPFNLRLKRGHHGVQRQQQDSQFSVSHDEATSAPSAGGDVSRVVQLIPGVSAADNSSSFRIRGSETEDSSIILDGLELYDPNHLAAFQSPYSLIDINSVDSIDLRAGGYTADLGDRHGGFVEITTMTPTERSGQIEFGAVNSRFTFRTPTSSQRGSWLLSARTWYADSLFNSTEVGSGDNVKPSFQDLYIKGSFIISPRLIISTHGLFGFDRLSLKETNEILNESANVVTRNANMWARAVYSLTDRLQMETTLSAGRIEKRRDGISAPDDVAFRVEDNRSIRFSGVKQSLRFSKDDRSLIKAGLEYRTLTAAYRYSFFDPTLPQLPTATTLNPTGSSASLFGSYRRKLGTNWTTEFGLRWDIQTYTDDNQFSPRFNAVWSPSTRDEFRFAAGRFQQSQRIHELNIQDGETEFSRAEASEQIEMSYQRLLKRGWRLRLDGYHRRLSNLRPRYRNLFEPIEIFPETTNDRIQYRPRRARLEGLELMIRSAAEDDLFWSASYSYATAKDLVADDWVPRDWDQRHTVKILIGFRVDDRWLFSMTGLAHSGWPTTPVSGQIVMLPSGAMDTELVVGDRNSIRFGGYSRIDVKMRRAFQRRHGKVSITVEIANILNQTNVCCVDDFIFESAPVGPTRVSREFDNWIGIRPGFNVLWEF
jgi:hypothetical protein